MMHTLGHVIVWVAVGCFVINVLSEVMYSTYAAFKARRALWADLARIRREIEEREQGRALGYTGPDYETEALRARASDLEFLLEPESPRRPNASRRS